MSDDAFVIPETCRMVRLTTYRQTIHDAMAAALGIVDEEGLAEPHIEITPVWIHNADGNHTQCFTVLVNGVTKRITPEETT